MIIVLTDKNYTYRTLSDKLIANLTKGVALWISTIKETLDFGIFERKLNRCLFVIKPTCCSLFLINVALI